MSPSPTSRAGELAAQQVEKIVEAAQRAGEQIKSSARAEGQTLLADARSKGAEELAAAKARATALVSDAEQRADEQMAVARRQAIQLGEESRREAAERVAGAEETAAEVIEEARAVTSGLRRLGELLTEQAERILTDVQAAHRRMTADLRVAGGRPAREESRAAASRPVAADEPLAGVPRERRTGTDRPRGGGPSPFEEIEPPGWVG